MERGTLSWLIGRQESFRPEGMGPEAGRVLSCLIGFRQEGNQPSTTATGKRKGKKVKLLSLVQLCDSMNCIACQPPLSMEYWSGLPYPSPEDLPDSGIEPGSLALQVDSLLSEPPVKPKTCFSSVQSLSHVRLFATP